MAAKKNGQSRSGPLKIHEAELAPGPSGLVFKGGEIELAAAVAQRKVAGDVVVCGNNVDSIRRLAETIESACGPCRRHDPHRQAGPHALPHYQQANPPPTGHTFYETENKLRKARKKP